MGHGNKIENIQVKFVCRPKMDEGTKDSPSYILDFMGNQKWHFFDNRSFSIQILKLHFVSSDWLWEDYKREGCNSLYSSCFQLGPN